MFNPFTAIGAKLLGGALVGALIFAGVQSYRANYWKQVATVLRLDLDKIKLAQLAATAAWQAKLSDNENRQRTAIQEARNEERKNAMLAAGAAYARTHRVVRAQAPRGDAGRAEDAQADPAARDDGSGGDAEMVALARPEFDLLVRNTIRLDTAQKQAQRLIDDGLAEPEVPSAPATDK